MARPRAHAKLDGGVPPEGDHQDAKGGQDDAHSDIRDVLGIHLAALELIAAVVPGQQTGEPDEHLAERGVHVKVKLALEIVRAKFAKVRLVPDHVRRLADLVEARPAGKEGVHNGRDMFQVLLYELALKVWGGREREKGATEVGVSDGDKGESLATTHDGSGWRRRASPRYPSSTAVLLKTTGLGIDVFTLRVVFVDPWRAVLRRCWGLRVMYDPAAGRSVVGHVIWEFFDAGRRFPVSSRVGGIMDKFKVFGWTGWSFWGCVNRDGNFRVWHGLLVTMRKGLSRATGPGPWAVRDEKR